MSCQRCAATAASLVAHRSRQPLYWLFIGATYTVYMFHAKLRLRPRRRVQTVANAVHTSVWLARVRRFPFSDILFPISLKPRTHKIISTLIRANSLQIVVALEFAGWTRFFAIVDRIVDHASLPLTATDKPSSSGLNHCS
jgi:hypothetical protein